MHTQNTPPLRSDSVLLPSALVLEPVGNNRKRGAKSVIVARSYDRAICRVYNLKPIFHDRTISQGLQWKSTHFVTHDRMALGSVPGNSTNITPSRNASTRTFGD